VSAAEGTVAADASLDGIPHVDGVSHRMVQAGEVRLHVAEAGSGDPVLMLHGWPQHWYCWRKVIPHLAPSYRLICPDLRGFGWSEAPGQGYDPETFASDAIALLDALEIDRARVIGHDWGGFAVFLLGLRHPDRVERILSLNAPHPWPPVDLRTLDALWRMWYVVLMAAAGRAILSRWPQVIGNVLRRDNVQPDALSDADLHVYLDRLRRPEQVRATQLLYRRYLRTFWSVTRERPYASMRLTPPARLLFGAQDFAISKSLLRGHERHADDFEIELVQDSGHFLPEEKPELVAERALAFLGSG
jgi:pimeloyl-ACP methyl ester carboxylesterase